MGYYDRVVLIGFGKIAQHCLKIIQNKFDGQIDVVIFEKGFFSSFQKNNDKVDFFEFDKKIEITNFLLNIDEDTLVVSANNNFIFPQIIVLKENFYIINFHNSLLPRHKGRNAQSWVIYNQELETGITWHKVNRDVDEGDVLFQKKIFLNGEETALSLTRILMDEGIKGFEELFLKIIKKEEVVVEKESNKIKDKLHLSSDIPNDGVLDLNWSIVKMDAFLRSLNYGVVNIFPKSKISFLGNEMIIKKYKISLVKKKILNASMFFMHSTEIEITDMKHKLTLYLEKNEK